MYLDQQLVDNLIHRYQTVLKWCKRMPSLHICKWITRLSNTNYGVCKCAESVFNRNITYDEYVNKNFLKNAGLPGYWAMPPGCCKNKSELIESLQIRIEILQKYEQYERNCK